MTNYLHSNYLILKKKKERERETQTNWVTVKIENAKRERKWEREGRRSDTKLKIKFVFFKKIKFLNFQKNKLSLLSLLRSDRGLHFLVLAIFPTQPSPSFIALFFHLFFPFQTRSQFQLQFLGFCLSIFCFVFLNLNLSRENWRLIVWDLER